MTKIPLLLVGATLSACASLPPSPPQYPPAPRADVLDDYFGTRVADPYRWLENPDSPETRAWVAAQNALSRPRLEALPARAHYRERLAELWNHERHSVPERAPDGTVVYSRNDGLQNQPVLYAERPGEPARVLLDPNEWSSDGTEALTHWTLSPDGRHMLYAVQSGGSDWVEYRLVEVATGRVLDDRLQGINFNFDASRIRWRGGNSGFFYSRFPATGDGAGAPRAITRQALYWHRVGTPQSEDVRVHDLPRHPEWFLWGEATADGRWLVMGVEREEDGDKEVWVKPLGPGPHPRFEAPFRRLAAGFDAHYALAGSQGDTLFFTTSRGAPRYRILAVDARSGAWREVVPQQADTLQGAQLLGGQLVARYLHDAAVRLRRYSLRGQALGEIPLPGLGTVAGLWGTQSQDALWFSYTSFSTPPTVHRYSLTDRTLTPWRAPALAFDPADYVTEQVFATSKDGARIPLFISHRRDLQRDGAARVQLYGYGGFNQALLPAYSTPALAWMERGNVYVQACLRGGGEYGEPWHRAGMLQHKQNVFDDFIAAAEYLVRSGWTTPGRIAIRGRSNGGLLVGAVLNQRPDLFGAATAGVGVLDMLRYHRFGIAYAWAGDYGRADDPRMFPVLRAYSPVHNVSAGARYPATLITTAERDDRVHPLHSYKFTAALQAAQAGTAPILLRVETRAGHGAGTALSKQIEEFADVLAFLEHHTAGPAGR